MLLNKSCQNGRVKLKQSAPNCVCICVYNGKGGLQLQLYCFGGKVGMEKDRNSRLRHK